MLFYTYFNKGRVVQADVVRLDKPGQLAGHRFDELRITGTLDRDEAPFKVGLRPWLESLRGCFYRWDEDRGIIMETREHVQQSNVFFLQVRLIKPTDIEFLLRELHSEHHNPTLRRHGQ